MNSLNKAKICSQSRIIAIFIINNFSELITVKSLCHFERGTASHNWPHKAKLKLPAFALLAASAHFWAKKETVNLVIHVLSKDGNGEDRVKLVEIYRANVHLWPL